VSLLEPAAVDTELFQADPGRLPAAARGGFQRLGAKDVADVIGYMVTRPRHIAVSELLVRPAEQER
jgi:NADP-dependent 3-hydroxy acid dehydrogenase YdfG